jgi:peptide/nickel transport system substrate-binding protein
VTRRDLLKGATAVAGVSALAACTPSSTPTPSGTGAKGGQIVFSTSSEPLGMNPNVGVTSASNTYFSPVVFDSMVRPGDDMGPTPSLAESWTSTPDGLNYTFKLRKDVKFHDGEAFTAKDVKFTFDVVNDKVNTGTGKFSYLAVKGAPAFQAGTGAGVSGVTTPDDYTVQVELTRPDASFLASIGGMYILPSHIYSKVAVVDMEKDATARKPVGTGPFKFVEWKSQEQFVADAFDGYWGGRPKMDRFVIRVVPDATTLPSLIKTGAIDAMGLFGSLAPTDYEAFSKDSNFKIYPLLGYTAWFIAFNVVDPAFQDVRVRRALIQATDRESILKNVLLGKGKIVDSPMHPILWAYSEPTTKPQFDLAKAKALLTEAGYAMGSDGYFAKSGQRLTVKLATYMGSTTYPEVIQAQWKQAGVDLQIDRTDFAAYWGPKFLARKFQAGGQHTASGIFTDPSGAFSFYYDSTRSPFNYKNTQVDTLLQRALGTSDRAQRKQLYAQATELIMQDAAAIQLAMPDENWVSTAKVKLPGKNMSVPMFHNLKDWERV